MVTSFAYVSFEMINNFLFGLISQKKMWDEQIAQLIISAL